MPNSRSRAKPVSAGGSALKPLAPLSSTMTPKKMLMVASVTTKLCSRVVTTIRPLIAPSAPPASRPSSSEAAIGSPKILQRPADRHRRTDADRAERQIEAAGQDHRHHRQPDDAVDADAARERIDVDAAVEAVGQQREPDREHRDRDRQPDDVRPRRIAQRARCQQRPAAPPAPPARSCAPACRACPLPRRGRGRHGRCVRHGHVR